MQRMSQPHAMEKIVHVLPQRIQRRFRHRVQSRLGGLESFLFRDYIAELVHAFVSQAGALVALA
jgi:hypothetical protein